MRSLLLSTLSLLPLGAQHFEGGTLYRPHVTYPDGKGMGHIGWAEVRLRVTTPDGRHHLMEPPPELQGRRGVCQEVAFLDGVAYACGTLNHPAFDRAGDQYFDSNRSSRRNHLPRVLYRRRGSGPWERLGLLPSGFGGASFSTFLALSGDRILVRTLGFPLLIKNRAVPFGLLVPDGRGGLGLEPFPGLEDVPEAILRKAHLVRVQGHLLLIPEEGARVLHVLDGSSGRRLPDQPLALFPSGASLLRALPRPDGRVLLALRQGEEKPKGLLPLPRYGDTPANRLVQTAFQRAVNRLQDTRHLSHLAWAVLDPSTGQQQPVPSPASLPADLPLWHHTHLSVLPNGNLEYASGSGPFPIQAAEGWLRFFPPTPQVLFATPRFRR